MRTKLVAMTLMVLATLAGQVVAHEGHEHKIMGKVVAIDERTIVVEGLDGKKITGILAPSTQYIREKVAVARSDVKVNERVVIVFVEEKEAQNVRQVLLGKAETEEHKPDHEH